MRTGCSGICRGAFRSAARLAHCMRRRRLELGSSRPLDFGHWAAHYMETMSGYILGHAEAVSVGMCLDILYSVRKGWLPAAEAERDHLPC
ncbi:MAG: hypothetical protein ACLT8C_02610 [Akkermansia muciniphila]